ncbi:hypothetical protein FACS1894163_09160 [Spirochaetia bacterium]|nr:hypothetical protein FACS1894163_09160 [Spirochaetia bacterium]
MAEDIIKKVFSFIGGGSEPVSDRELLPRQTLKALAQNRYAKFYRPKTDEIDPSFAQYIYVIYKTIYPAQVFLRDAEKIKKLKQICFEHSLSPELLAAVWRLSPEMIEDRAKETAPNDLVRRLQDDFAAVSSAFDDKRRAAVNKCYNLISAFSQLVLFDYVSFLQKFDSALAEGVFDAPLKFAALRGDSLAQELGDFFTALSALDPSLAQADGDDWAAAFTVMNAAYGAASGGTDVLSSSQWDILLANMRELRQSKILELMVRLSSKNYIWEGKVKIPDEHLCENWFEEKKGELHARISVIAKKQQNDQIHTLAAAIFGKPDIERLGYYTPSANQIYVQKGLDGFAYAAALNYLMAFIQDYVKKDIQNICDLVLIRGKWSSSNTSLQMSESFHEILESISVIEKLDANLSEDGGSGPRLRGALLRVDRDKTQIRYIANIIEGIDEEALKLIKKVLRNLIVVGKNMKLMADDIQKKESELIMNWKELAVFLESPLPALISDTYKKINYFVQLMTLVTHPVE